MWDWRMHTHVCIRAYELMQSSHALLQLLPTGWHCRTKKWSSARIWSTHTNHINYSLIYKKKQVQTKASDMLYQTDWNIGDNCLSIVCNCHAWFCYSLGQLSYKSQAYRLIFTVTSISLTSPHDAYFKAVVFFFLFFFASDSFKTLVCTHNVLFSLHHPSRLSASVNVILSVAVNKYIYI